MESIGCIRSCKAANIGIEVTTMEYYSATKKNEIGSFGVTWMDLEAVIQSEVSQREKNKYIIAHIDET